METILSWIAVGIGAAGMLLGIVFGRGEAPRERMRGGWIVAAAAVLGTVLLFLVTFLLKEPPFAYGQRLGYGILIGGLLGAAAGVYSTRLGGKSLWGSGIAAAGLPSLALIGAGLVLLLFPSYPQPALAGFVIGSLLSAVLFRLALPGMIAMEAWGLSAAALGATVLLGTFRYGIPADRFWWRAPLMVVAAAVVAQIASAAAAREGRRFGVPALAASLITLALVAVFAWKVFPQWPLLYVAAAGVGTFAVAAWLLAAAPASASAASIATLAVVALSAVGFRLLGGFGIGIGMLAAWSILLPALASVWREERDQEEHFGPARAVIYAMFIGIGVLLYRLFLETYSSDLRGLDLRAHYTFIALALGVIFPFVLMSFFPISARRGAGWRTAEAGAAGLFAAAAPLAVLVLWGFKATLGFVVGTVAAEVFILFIYTGAVKLREQRFVESALLVLAAQISVLQFSGLLGSFIEMPRIRKVIVLACVIAIGLVWAGVSALLARGSSKES